MTTRKTSRFFSLSTPQARHNPTVALETDGVLTVMTWSKVPIKARGEDLVGPPCPKRGFLIIAAEASEFLSEEQIRNKWSCDECGYEFHTVVSLARCDQR
jgi:hypothetical protein